MSEIEHSAQALEQFQSALKLYRKKRETIRDAIQTREAYQMLYQGEEELNNREDQPLFDAAVAENTMRDRFTQMKKEITELVQKYMNEGKYQDSIDTLNNLMEFEDMMASLKSDDYTSGI